MLRNIVLVGDVSQRLLSDLIGGYQVRVVAQMQPEDLQGWGKAMLGRGMYEAVVAGNGLENSVHEALAQLSTRRDFTLVRYKIGMGAEALAQQIGAEPAKAAPLIVISFNNKGGTGKSTLAANAAVRLAHAGKQTLLIDDDVQNGDVAHYVGLDSEGLTHIGDLMQYRDRHMEPDDIRQIITPSERYGLHVLPAPPTPTGLSFTVPQAWELASALAELSYEVIVIDSPPGLTQGTLTQALLQDSRVNVALLPFTDDRAGVKGFREARSRMLERVPQQNILPVLMRTRPDVIQEADQISELQGLDVLEVPYHADLARCPVLSPNGHSSGMTMLRAVFGNSRDEVSVALDTLAQRLTDALATVER
jgi:cellulose biosynthesis protein BcsQ